MMTQPASPGSQQGACGTDEDVFCEIGLFCDAGVCRAFADILSGIGDDVCEEP